LGGRSVNVDHVSGGPPVSCHVRSTASLNDTTDDRLHALGRRVGPRQLEQLLSAPGKRTDWISV
jgi:hypothetical protein